MNITSTKVAYHATYCISLPKGDIQEQVQAAESFIFGTASSSSSSAETQTSHAPKSTAGTSTSPQKAGSQNASIAAVATTSRDSHPDTSKDHPAPASPQEEGPQQTRSAEPSKSIAMATGPSNTSSLSSSGTSPDHVEHHHGFGSLFPRLHRKTHSGHPSGAPAAISSVAPDHEASSRQLP